MEEIQRQVPSLLEPESRGGDVAEGGFTFQDSVILSWIPKWLSLDGFECMIREATGDTEAKFYVPGRGYVIEFVEVKNHPLTPTEFWSEIERFRAVDSGSPGTYGWFTLVATGLSEGLRPLVNGLRRVREPYGFYDPTHGIWSNSMADYITLVTAEGHSEEEGRFLFERVLILPQYGTAQQDGEALFRQAMADYLPWVSDSSKAIGLMYHAVSALIKSLRNHPIHRFRLEDAIRTACPGNTGWHDREITLHTTTSEGTKFESGLLFQWKEFFGGTARQYPDTKVWNERLLTDLTATESWIRQHRRERKIRLTGDRRLSGCLAVGAVFSAVAGFQIYMETRGSLWKTDAYSSPTTAPYYLDVQRALHSNRDLVFTLGIIRDIKADVIQFLSTQGLQSCPRVHVQGHDGIASSEQADLIIRTVKAEVSEALSTTGADTIHMFFAGPSFLAVLLGHRLNATRPIQCYEWVAPGVYVPTCILPTA